MSDAVAVCVQEDSDGDGTGHRPREEELRCGQLHRGAIALTPQPDRVEVVVHDLAGPRSEVAHVVVLGVEIAAGEFV